MHRLRKTLLAKQRLFYANPANIYRTLPPHIISAQSSKSYEVGIYAGTPQKIKRLISL